VPKIRSDLLALVLFCASLLLLAFAYGVAVGRFRIFPYVVLTDAVDSAKAMRRRLTGEKSRLYMPTTFSRKLPRYLPDAAYPGLNLVTAVAADDRLAAYIMDMEGKVIHSWEVDWFEIWPDAGHLPDKVLPKERPGTHIHGAVVLDDGDIVYNYEHLGLVRLGLCGEVVWRLPYRTHHSIHRDDEGDLWVSAQINRLSKDARYTNHKPEFIEPIILEVSQSGKIKSEISVLELLSKNGLSGLLYMSAKDNRKTSVSGDTLHLNDIEPFPSTLQPGLFSPGDLLISLRNIHTVFVFTVATRKIKHVWTGEFVRQHDPDFLDGNTISVFDNNNIDSEAGGQQSRILLLSAASGERTVYFAGSDDAPFYSDIMGKSQWLPNSNLLISESMKGRAFEIDRDGRIVWEYINLVGDGYAAVMEEVQRLPERMNQTYSESSVSAKCAKAHD
jgi:hypothetical protein